jgi:hypothetical protein
MAFHAPDLSRAVDPLVSREAGAQLPAEYRATMSLQARLPEAMYTLIADTLPVVRLWKAKARAMPGGLRTPAGSTARSPSRIDLPPVFTARAPATEAAGHAREKRAAAE